MIADNSHPVDAPNLLLDGVVTAKLTNGKHFTYRLSSVRRGALDGKRIVELMIGPDNEHSFKAWGFIDEDARIRMWKRFQGSEAYKKHRLLLMGKAQEHVECWLQAGRCLKCGRVLTNPESIVAGVGPVCGGRV